MALFKLFVPKQAVGANLVYFDFFCAGSNGVDVKLLSVLPIVSGEVAVTGVVGVDLFLTRTTAVGTGGTAATAEGTSLTACTLSAFDTNQPHPAGSLGLSARLTPTGGATAGAVLGWRAVYTEETNAGTYTPAPDLISKPCVIFCGTGFRIVQGGVASVGNIGFDCTLDITRR